MGCARGLPLSLPITPSLRLFRGTTVAPKEALLLPLPRYYFFLSTRATAFLKSLASLLLSQLSVSMDRRSGVSCLHRLGECEETYLRCVGLFPFVLSLLGTVEPTS